MNNNVLRMTLTNFVACGPRSIRNFAEQQFDCEMRVFAGQFFCFGDSSCCSTLASHSKGSFSKLIVSIAITVVYCNQFPRKENQFTFGMLAFIEQ